MEEIDRKSVDKSGWSRGPWDDEPDRVDFEHAGLPCLLLRNRHGNWCGYAAVAPGHPWHGVDYNGCFDPKRHVDAEEHGWKCDARPESVIEVHGGLTYADRCGGSICHVPKPGEPADVWWFGFDCGHAWDIQPGLDAESAKLGLPRSHYFDEHYRDVAYVRRETEKLAEQLARVGTGLEPEKNEAPK